MLKFKVPADVVPLDQVETDKAYLVDAEDQPIRGEIRLRGDTLFCDRKSEGLVALVLPLDVPDVGRVLLSTAHLPDRERPYNLLVELLRGLVLRAWRKKDDWGYAYRGPTPEFASGLDDVKSRMARAMSLEVTDAEAGVIAREAISEILRLSEDLTLEHAHRGLIYRRDNRELADLDFGCWIDLSCQEKSYQERLFESFNYVTLPMDWRTVEPREHEFQWATLDFWVNWLTSKGMAIKAGQLLRFRESCVPDWVYIWEGDFDSIRDYAFEHTLRCVQRYASKIEHWDITTGLHVENCLKFSLEQVMEMTTMCSRVVKKNAPHARAILDLVMPWGEYCAGNPRSIWPLKYVEMCINAGVEFDAIGLQIFMGADGYYCRDIMAVSALLDLFGTFGKPLHVTAAGVPSAGAPDGNDASRGKRDVKGAGCWHEPWSPAVQSRWVDAFYNIAVGKPFVEAVCWTELSDRPGHFFPHAGLLGANLEPKDSYAAMLGMRREIWPEMGIPEHRATEEAKPWAEY
ncbi:MAG: endo-1,4-beta-xylanase [Planctomycetes bacterium]|nr:endo-1,4-beta-xylanase [Planctomycetota bacterium]